MSPNCHAITQIIKHAEKNSLPRTMSPCGAPMPNRRTIVTPMHIHMSGPCISPDAALRLCAVQCQCRSQCQCQCRSQCQCQCQCQSVPEPQVGAVFAHRFAPRNPPLLSTASHALYRTALHARDHRTGGPWRHSVLLVYATRYGYDAMYHKLYQLYTNVLLSYLSCTHCTSVMRSVRQFIFVF